MVREHSCTSGRHVNWYGHYGRQYGESSKNLKQNYSMTQDSTVGYIHKRTENRVSKRYCTTPMFIATLFTIAKQETIQVSIEMNG